MHCPQCAVDLDVLAVTSKREPDEAIGPEQAAEPRPVDIARREAVRLIYDNGTQGAPLTEQGRE